MAVKVTRHGACHGTLPVPCPALYPACGGTGGVKFKSNMMSSWGQGRSLSNSGLGVRGSVFHTW